MKKQVILSELICYESMVMSEINPGELFPSISFICRWMQSIEG